MRHNSITIDLTEEAIAYLELLKAGDEPSYREIAEEFSVDRTVLSRRH
jgi:hypothetical protein